MSHIAQTGTIVVSHFDFVLRKNAAVFRHQIKSSIMTLQISNNKEKFKMKELGY